MFWLEHLLLRAHSIHSIAWILLAKVTVWKQTTHQNYGASTAQNTSSQVKVVKRYIPGPFVLLEASLHGEIQQTFV